MKNHKEFFCRFFFILLIIVGLLLIPVLAKHLSDDARNAICDVASILFWPVFALLLACGISMEAKR